MSFFEFPHTRTYDMDLGWLIWAMRKLIGEMQEFANLNSIKFADPISWTIDRNYEPATIVIDSDGNGFISRRPVPAGVPLSNADYWTQIFNFGDLTSAIRESVALPNFKNSPTATENISKGELLWFNNLLYVALSDFNAGTALLPDQNIERVTVEDYFNIKIDALNESVDGLNDEVTNINEMLAGLDEKISKYWLANVRNYGAEGDGSTDDTEAILSAINDTDFNGILLPAGTYKVSDTLFINRSNFVVMGYGAKIIKDSKEHVFTPLKVSSIETGYSLNNIHILGLEIDGQLATGESFDGSVAPLIAVYADNDYPIGNIVIRDCYVHNNKGRGIGLDGGTLPYYPRVTGVVIDSCKVSYTNGAIIQSCVTSTISNCFLEKSGVENITIDNGCLNCKVIGNTLQEHLGGTGGIGIDQSRETIIQGNIINGLNAIPAASAGAHGIALNCNRGLNRNCIITDNIIYNNSGYGIIARKTNDFNSVQYLNCADNNFMGNTTGDIFIMSAENRNNFSNNRYLNHNKAIVLDDISILDHLYNVDAPIYLDVASLLGAGWTIGDANYTKIFYLNNTLHIVGRFVKGSGAGNTILTLPSYLRPAVNYYGYSDPHQTYLSTGGALNAAASATGTITVGFAVPCHISSNIG